MPRIGLWLLKSCLGINFLIKEPQNFVCFSKSERFPRTYFLGLVSLHWNDYLILRIAQMQAVLKKIVLKGGAQ